MEKRVECGLKPLCMSCSGHLTNRKMLASTALDSCCKDFQDPNCQKDAYRRYKGAVYCRNCFNRLSRNNKRSAPAITVGNEQSSANALLPRLRAHSPTALDATPFRFLTPTPQVSPAPRASPSSPLTELEGAASVSEQQTNNYKRRRDDAGLEGGDHDDVIKLDSTEGHGHDSGYNIQRIATRNTSPRPKLRSAAQDTDIGNVNLNEEIRSLAKRVSAAVTQHLQDFCQGVSPKIMKAADGAQSLRHAYDLIFGPFDISRYPASRGMVGLVGYLIYDLVFCRSLELPTVYGDLPDAV